MALRLLFLQLSAAAALALFSLLLANGKSAATVSPCTTHDPHNTLAEQFPNSATGVLNATLAIIPISLGTARRLIPPQYGILERAYRSLVPNFPEGMYPLMVQAAHDHDVQLRAYGITIDDFSVSLLQRRTASIRREGIIMLTKSSVSGSSFPFWISPGMGTPPFAGPPLSSLVQATLLP